MKRITYLVVLLFASLAIYSGCSKEETNGTPVTYDSATITGKVQIDLDLTNDTAGILYEKVPAGTIIHAKYNSQDLVTNSDPYINYSDVFIRTTASASGTYTLRIPVNKQGVAVSIYSDDIEADQTKADTTIDKAVVFNLPQVNVNVKPHQTLILDLKFAKK